MSDMNYRSLVIGHWSLGSRFAAVLAMVSTITLFAAQPQEDMTAKIRQQNMNVVKAAAESMNKELPKRVDRYTRLLAIKPKGETLQYIFEIAAPPKSDAQIKEEAKSRHMQTRVTQGLCRSSARFLKSGIDIEYLYRSAATGKTLMDYKVSKKDCPMLD